MPLVDMPKIYPFGAKEIIEDWLTVPENRMKLPIIAVKESNYQTYIILAAVYEHGENKVFEINGSFFRIKIIPDE